METAKQKAIREVYGESYESIKEFLDDNGWISNWAFVRVLNSPHETFQMKGNIYRPKSLQGIEDNNGWTKIESEHDLPKENTQCWIKDEEFGIDIGCFNAKKQKWFVDSVEQFVTHYQPIVKPNPPLY